MPWNEADRTKYDVIRARYSSDMSEAKFALIAPLLPPPKRRGRKPTEGAAQDWGCGDQRSIFASVFRLRWTRGVDFEVGKARG
jgi:hypothetical protein